MPEIRNFSKQRKAIVFQIDEDVFEALPAIPAEVMIQFAERVAVADPTQLSVTQQIAIFRELLELVLTDASMARMRERMSDRTNPVDMEQLDEIITWLFEEYGMRPTTESDSSSNGVSPPATGITSMVPTPGMASISAASPLISS